MRYILAMDVESLREFCRKLPFVTEDIKWEDHLCFSVAGKMFVVCSLDAASPHRISFKSTPEDFAQLIEREGVVPAPYLARNHWVALESFDAMRDPELREHVSAAYQLKLAALPKRIREQIAEGKAPESALRKRPPKKKAAGKKAGKKIKR